jgi:hypothetical protein
MELTRQGIQMINLIIHNPFKEESLPKGNSGDQTILLQRFHRIVTDEVAHSHQPIISTILVISRK